MITSAQKLLMARAGASGAGGGISLDFITTVDEPNNLTTVTFNGVSIGAASSDRLVVAVFHATGGAASSISKSSISINSTTPTDAIDISTFYSNINVAYLAVPSGTTADFSITYSNTKNRTTLAVYTLKNYTSATPTNTDSVVYATTTSTVSGPITLDIPQGSVALYSYNNGQGFETVTFSDATKNYNQQVGGEGTTCAGGVLYDAGLAHDETATIGSARNGRAFSGVVWA
jgi:hypothetical protein